MHLYAEISLESAAVSFFFQNQSISKGFQLLYVVSIE